MIALVWPLCHLLRRIGLRARSRTPLSWSGARGRSVICELRWWRGRLRSGTWGGNWAVTAAIPLCQHDHPFLRRALRDGIDIVLLDDFDLRTDRRDNGYGRTQVGMTGWLTLRVTGKVMPVVPRTMGTLTRFAEFCGTGAQTTHGFGATTVAVVPA